MERRVTRQRSDDAQFDAHTYAYAAGIENRTETTSSCFCRQIEKKIDLQIGD